MNQAHYDRMEHPKKCAPDDFWGQIRRTVKGKPVDASQIAMIRHAICDTLKFTSDDYVLDICCGNGALTAPLFDSFQAYLGVDISPVLIEIANDNFKREQTHTFINKSAFDYVDSEKQPERFTVALCYGAFQYFSEDEAKNVLSLLRSKFCNIRTLFIGALPDANKADVFWDKRDPLPLDDHTTAIGRWYSQNALVKLGKECGWQTTCSVMPQNFYQSHYRFDATLIPGDAV